MLPRQSTLYRIIDRRRPGGSICVYIVGLLPFDKCTVLLVMIKTTTGYVDVVVQLVIEMRSTSELLQIGRCGHELEYGNWRFYLFCLFLSFDNIINATFQVLINNTFNTI